MLNSALLLSIEFLLDNGTWGDDTCLPAGETYGMGEDWGSGMSSLQSIDKSSLGLEWLGLQKYWEIILTSSAIFLARVCFDFIVNLLGV